jgi:hypothetical protein
MSRVWQSALGSQRWAKTDILPPMSEIDSSNMTRQQLFMHCMRYCFALQTDTVN